VGTSALLIVLTGKTASGKDTILAKLRQKYPNLHKIITTTSRHKRRGEENGVDYHFITKEEFRKKIDSKDFVEFVEYGSNMYGTEKTELEAALSKTSIWRIDPSRAGEVRDFINRAFSKEQANQLLDHLVVFYITTNKDVILKRLKARNLPQKEIETRLDDDELIWQKFKNKYDYIIENTPGKLNETLARIINIIDIKNETA